MFIIKYIETIYYMSGFQCHILYHVSCMQWIYDLIKYVIISDWSQEILLIILHEIRQICNEIWKRFNLKCKWHANPSVCLSPDLKCRTRLLWWEKRAHNSLDYYDKLLLYIKNALRTKVSLKHNYMWPLSTKSVISITDIFVAIANDTLYGFIIHLCQKLLGY